VCDEEDTKCIGNIRFPFPHTHTNCNVDSYEPAVHPDTQYRKGQNYPNDTVFGF
jgi:hypothetical protein